MTDPVTRIAALYRGYQDTLPARVWHRVIAIGGYDRALALAAQAFVALVPAALILSWAAGSPSAAAAASGLGLSRRAAETLTGCSANPPAPSRR